MTSTPKKRGFTLVELAIVIGVIAVLSLVVVSASYFIESAKIGSAVQMVSTVRTASRAYAKRVCGGIGFSCAAGNISIASLQAEFLLPPNMCNPWCDNSCAGACGVGVIAAGGNINIQIGICIPNGAATTDASAALAPVGAVAGGGPCGGCPAGTACLGVTTR